MHSDLFFSCVHYIIVVNNEKSLLARIFISLLAIIHPLYIVANKDFHVVANKDFNIVANNHSSMIPM